MDAEKDGGATLAAVLAAATPEPVAPLPVRITHTDTLESMEESTCGIDRHIQTKGNATDCLHRLVTK